jgi:hypothetical protein
LKLGRTYWVRVLTAHGLLSIADDYFDRVVYPLVLVWLGAFMGFVVMTLASMIWCGTFLWIYERGKVDWLGVDAVEAVKERGQYWIARIDSKNIFVRFVAWIPTRIFLIVLWAIKKNDVSAFIALTLYEDAFKTTAFLRKGKFGHFGSRDVKIFLSSLVLSNVYWTIQWSVIIEIFKWAYRMIIA